MKLLSAALVVALAMVGLSRAAAFGAERPNIVVVMTDDQDDTSSLDFMPKLRALMKSSGTRFKNSFVNFSLCCPSRTSWLTGQAAHNHGVRGNHPPFGGWPTWPAAERPNNLGTWLQRAGYRTGYVASKLLNGYERDDPTYVLPGWDDWHVTVAGDFGAPTVNDNGVLNRYAAYGPDLQTEQALGFIRSAGTAPFFLFVAPAAPHNPAIPAARHRGRYADVTLPRPKAFDEAGIEDKPSFMRDLPRLDEKAVAALERQYRNRLEALLAVDDMVERIIGELRFRGLLDRTLVIFTSDNGYMLGEHRFVGKRVAYEASLRVPLVLWGAGVPAGAIRDHLVDNLDLVATVVDFAGAAPGRVLDGRSIRPILADPKAAWRTALPFEGSYGKPRERGFTSGLRTTRWAYMEHVGMEGGFERELYDLDADPDQLDNLVADPRYAAAASRLRALLAVGRSCAGQSCWIDEPSAAIGDRSRK